MGNEKRKCVFDKQALMLTVEELDKHENLRNLSPEMKEKLIAFVYDVALILYQSYYNENES